MEKKWIHPRRQGKARQGKARQGKGGGRPAGKEDDYTEQETDDERENIVGTEREGEHRMGEAEP